MAKGMDFYSLRQEMVERQLLPRGITDKRVIETFRQVPRHRFVSKEYQESAYIDSPLPIGENQTISQPYIVALMTQLLELKETDSVLEIGTGSGYQAAILANLAKIVYSVERKTNLAKSAKTLLNELGYQNIKIVIGDGTLGLEEFSPFDKIIVTAAAPMLPTPLKNQLKDSGYIVIPISAGFGQILSLFKKHQNKLEKKEICGCTFVPLVGKHGYNK